MMTDIFINILLYIAFLGFAAKRLMVYLHAFQQEEYDNPRFLSWLFLHRLFDKRLSGILLIPSALWFFADEYMFFINLVVLGAFASFAYRERDPRENSKKKLAMTSRAKRIFISAIVLIALSGSFVFIMHFPFLWIVCVQLIPFLLVCGNLLLQPYEDFVQKRFWNEAHRKVLDLSPTVIGVTGSFGKTSVKHILGHILQNVAPTLVTPGSVNTPMGIARIIREQLDETHRYFIVEMGAYGPYSIARLCDLTPPDYAMITAIGHAHYERFKTLEAVAKTKYELADAAVKKDGQVIVHENTLKFPYPEDFRLEHPNALVICGEDNNNPLKIVEIKQTLSGLDVQVEWKNQTYFLEAPLFGLHHGENIALCFAMACTIGIDPKVVVNALKTTPQIPHRLQVKVSGKDSAIIIDDAYNSNPRGFNSALALIQEIGKKKRKILVTPGMVELGKAHDKIHEQVGVQAARVCDIVIAIQPKRIPTFIDAFRKEARADQELMEMETFEEAQKWINDNVKKGDIVLLENDLPDVYERLPKF